MSGTIRQQLVDTGARLNARGLAPGSSGNVSVLVEDTIIMTPTGASLGDLDPDGLSELDRSGNHLGGPRPSKEFGLHAALYATNPQCTAIVHLHSIHAVAVSCLDGLSELEPLPRLTPYFAMKVPSLQTVAYAPPGSEELARAVADAARNTPFMLLRNHGSVAGAPTLRGAADAAEEIEQAAALALLLDGRCVQPVTPSGVAPRLFLALAATASTPPHVLATTGGNA